LSGFYKDAAPPALGPAGFEAHAKRQEKVRTISHTMATSGIESGRWIMDWP